MDQCGPCLKRRRHDSEQSVSSGTSSCSPGLEYTDLEAAEALVCMSSWGQPLLLSGSSNTLNPCKPRPLTPASDSCDFLLPLEIQEPSRDFVSLSSLVRPRHAVLWKTHSVTEPLPETCMRVLKLKGDLPSNQVLSCRCRVIKINIYSSGGSSLQPHKMCDSYSVVEKVVALFGFLFFAFLSCLNNQRKYKKSSLKIMISFVKGK